MSAAFRQLPLPRRVLAHYLMPSLAGLLVCVGMALTLSWRGVLPDYVSVCVLSSLAVLLAGTIGMKRVVAPHTELERQLRRVAALDSAADLALQPLRGRDPVAAGWNAILTRLSGQSALDRLASRLNEASSGGQAERLLAALDRLPDGICVTGADGTVVAINRSFGTLLGLPPGQSPDVSIEQLLLRRAPRRGGEISERLAPGLRSTTLELTLGKTPAEGVLRVARCQISGTDGSAGWVWSIRDVTQQKLAEDMRNQFVATATHELRTPLANIKAYAETLASCEDIEVAQQRQFYNTINAEATRLARFVDELLSVNQMESGSVSLNRHETDTLRLIDEIAARVQPEIARKGIQYEQRLPPKLPMLNIDKDKIVACMVNLLGNAVKYTPDNGYVGLQVEADGERIQFHVEDSGIGIAPEELPRLGSKFFRSDDERVRAENGSGLGLAFTMEIARLHGGEVTIQSELNRGSRFTLTLPLAAS